MRVLGAAVDADVAVAAAQAALDTWSMTSREERLALLEAEGLRTNWDTMAVAMRHLQETGEAEAALEWAAAAEACARVALGDDNEHVLRYRSGGTPRQA